MLGSTLKARWSYACSKAIDEFLALAYNKEKDLTESLFRKVLERYADGPAAYVYEALKEGTAGAVVERLLWSAARLHSDLRHPKGCLVVQGALSCGEAADSIRRELNMRRIAGETTIRKRLERAKSQGDLPSDLNPADLARYLATVIYGIAVQAAGAASPGEFRRVVQMVLRAWPSHSAAKE